MIKNALFYPKGYKKKTDHELQLLKNLVSIKKEQQNTKEKKIN